jgi:hypothetical protein
MTVDGMVAEAAGVAAGERHAVVAISSRDTEEIFLTATNVVVTTN